MQKSLTDRDHAFQVRKNKITINRHTEEIKICGKCKKSGEDRYNRKKREGVRSRNAQREREERKNITNKNVQTYTLMYTYGIEESENIIQISSFVRFSSYLHSLVLCN